MAVEMNRKLIEDFQSKKSKERGHGNHIRGEGLDVDWGEIEKKIKQPIRIVKEGGFAAVASHSNVMNLEKTESENQINKKSEKSEKQKKSEKASSKKEKNSKIKALKDSKPSKQTPTAQPSSPPPPAPVQPRLEPSVSMEPKPQTPNIFPKAPKKPSESTRSVQQACHSAMNNSRLEAQSEYEKKVNSSWNLGRDDTIEASSINCRSENESLFSLEEHLNGLAESLNSLIKAKEQGVANQVSERREMIYRQTHQFIKNMSKFDFDRDLLIKKKIGKYLSLIYSQLVKINDSRSMEYSCLLTDTSILLSNVKRMMMNSYKKVTTDARFKASKIENTTPTALNTENEKEDTFGDGDSIRMSATPSLDEKINYLIQNQTAKPQETPKEIKPGCLITIDEDEEERKPPQPSSKIPGMDSTIGLLTTAVSRAPLAVKHEENHEKIMMDQLRRRICRKIFSIFRDEHKLPTSEARRITLSIEGKVNELFPSYSSCYIFTIKNLFKKLKNNEITLKGMINLALQPMDKFSKICLIQTTLSKNSKTLSLEPKRKELAFASCFKKNFYLLQNQLNPNHTCKKLVNEFFRLFKRDFLKFFSGLFKEERVLSSESV